MENLASTKGDGRSAKELALDVATFLDSKRAEDIVVVDVQSLLPITSYFVLASGSSSRTLRALAAGVKKILSGSNFTRLGMQGSREGRWMCLDYTEVVVHLFAREAREFYDLDHLWADAIVLYSGALTDVNLTTDIEMPRIEDVAELVLSVQTDQRVQRSRVV